MRKETNPAKFVFIFFCDTIQHLHIIIRMSYRQIQCHDLQHVIQLKSLAHDTCHTFLFQIQCDWNFLNIFIFCCHFSRQLHQTVWQFHPFLFFEVYLLHGLFLTNTQINFQEIFIFWCTFKQFLTEFFHHLQIFFYGIVLVFQIIYFFCSFFFNFFLFVFYVPLINVNAILYFFLIFFPFRYNIHNRCQNSNAHCSGTHNHHRHTRCTDDAT